MEETSVFEKFELHLSQSAKDFLRETAKWAYIVSIIGFIGIAFLLLMALFAGTLFSTLGNTVPGMGVVGGSFGLIIGIIYFVLAAIYFFPVYYLFKYAKGTKEALLLHDSDALEAALGYLKSHHKFVGIMMIVILSIYVVALFGIIVAAAAFGH